MKIKTIANLITIIINNIYIYIYIYIKITQRTINKYVSK